MTNEPQSFRNHLVSLLQSAAAQTTRVGASVESLVAHPAVPKDLVGAVEEIGRLVDAKVALPTAAPAGLAPGAWNCARAGYELLKALASGDLAKIASVQQTYDFSTCDAGWAKTLVSYAGYFGVDGKRGKIPYIHAADVGDHALPLKANARIALVGDWGTGTTAAVDLLQQVAALKPDVLIHLGDIYYSGTEQECAVNFRNIVDKVLTGPDGRIPVYTLAGNHDMYSGGKGFYGLISTLNPPPVRQPASFFCLRSDDNAWQFVAMDTGKNDYDPLTVTDVLTKLEPDEEDWLTARIKEFGGKTILLSHHQLFSALSQIGPRQPDGTLRAFNPNLAASFQRFSEAAPGRIAAWFWGHEHALTIYKPLLGLDRGRCVGHGAVPVFVGGDAAPNTIKDPPQLLVDIHLDADKTVYRHGFAILELQGDGSGLASYYETGNSAAQFTEPL